MGDGDRENHQKAHGPPSLEVAAQEKQQRHYINKDIQLLKVIFGLPHVHTHSLANTEAEAKPGRHKF